MNLNALSVIICVCLEVSPVVNGGTRRENKINQDLTPASDRLMKLILL